MNPPIKPNPMRYPFILCLAIPVQFCQYGLPSTWITQLHRYLPKYNKYVSKKGLGLNPDFPYDAAERKFRNL